MAWPRSTCQASFAHNYWTELSNARINQFSDGFFASTSCLWNSLPSSEFLASFNLPSLGTKLHDFQASFAHNYWTELSNARINQFSDGFFPSTSCLWNSLPSSEFLASFNLPSLGTRLHDFFFFIYTTNISLKYFSNLFYSFHCLPFSFLKGYKLEKK